MGEFFSLLHFSSPAFLGLALASPLLIFAYLKRRELRTKMVSSVLILKVLKTRVRPRTRFKPPLRFFLELLALLLLSLAAAEPLFRHEGKRVAVVLDNSLSMQAKLSSSPARFQLALSALQTWLGRESSGNRYTLFLTAPAMKQVGEQNITAAELQSAAAAVKPSSAADALAPAIKELGDSAAYDLIFAVTDKQPEYISGTEFLSRSAETTVMSETLGSAVPNVFLSSFRYQSETVGHREVVIGIALSGNRLQEVTVKLSEQLSKTQEKLLTEKTVTVSPEKTTEVTVELADDISVSSVLKAQLSASSDSNALTADDSAWLVVGESKKTAVLLVTPETGGLGLESVFALKTVTPEQYRLLNDQALQQYALLIFDKSAPAYATHTPTLLILPPEKNPLFPVVREEAHPIVTSWLPDHPLTSYLRVPLLEIGAAVIFDTPAWAQSVVNSENGCLVVAGESKGVRFAGVGFELFPFEGAKTPTISILTLNLSRWLLGGNTFETNYAPGSSLKLAGDRSWVLQNPSGEISQQTTGATNSSLYVFDQPGIYQISSVSGKTLESIARTQEKIAVNVFLPEESRTYQRETFQTARRFPREKSATKSDAVWWPFCAASVFALLCLELLLRVLQPREAQTSVT